jgi:hypothetical protein
MTDAHDTANTDAADPDAVEFLKFAAGLVTAAMAEFDQLSENPAPAVETIRARMHHLRAELVAAVDRSSAPENRYTDGRAVISTLDLGSRIFIKVWHPDFNHPMNAPAEVGVDYEAGRRVIVAAPGHLDSVPLTTESAQAADGLGAPSIKKGG